MTQTSGPDRHTPHELDEDEASKWHINLDTGFMLQEPLKVLPAYFDPWNILASAVPTLYSQGRLREAVHKLPLLDHCPLSGHRQLRLAHLQLSSILSGYVWQGGGLPIVKVVPECLAVPYWRISELLGLRPIMCHADYVLANWSLVDPNGSFHIENLQLLYHFPGAATTDWFLSVIVSVELRFASCLQPMLRIISLLKCSQELERDPCMRLKTETDIAACLQTITSGIKAMQTAMSRMKDHLDVDVFFWENRPFFFGWGGADSPLPDGLVFAGVSDTPVKMTGGNTAQSSTFQALDAFLGVVHADGKKEFLVKMREFMPLDHRRFLEYLEQLPFTLRDFVTGSHSADLKFAYSKSVSALASLRAYHLQLARKYVVEPSNKIENLDYNDRFIIQGTGGTKNIIPFLRDIWLDTRQKLLSRDISTTKKTSRDDSKLGRLPAAVACLVLAVLFLFVFRVIWRH